TGPDYYIGRLMSVNLRNPNIPSNKITFGNLPDICGNTTGLIGKDIVNFMEKAVTPDSLFFNVFVYGNGDGSKINYTIKEDDDQNGTYVDGIDESYEKPIVVDFFGWKLFSLRYSDFTKAQYRNSDTGKDETATSGNKSKDINHIINVQFGLVSGTLGGKAQMIIDVPTVSVGKPFSY
ncbi:MAG: hypothetical protein H7329_11775, partial [Opitutaceae bacterium]|nr:hypothetical protein [Cytophagales bacterium]